MGVCHEGAGLLAAILGDRYAWDRYLVYADWLGERGDDHLALACRWMGRRMKTPEHYEYLRTGVRIQSGLHWLWAGEWAMASGVCVDHLPDTARLPRALEMYVVGHHHTWYATFEGAVVALADGLARLGELIIP